MCGYFDNEWHRGVKTNQVNNPKECCINCTSNFSNHVLFCFVSFLLAIKWLKVVDSSMDSSVSKIIERGKEIKLWLCALFIPQFSQNSDFPFLEKEKTSFFLAFHFLFFFLTFMTMIRVQYYYSIQQHFYIFHLFQLLMMVYIWKWGLHLCIYAGKLPIWVDPKIK